MRSKFRALVPKLFKPGPNLSFMNISRLKPPTLKETYFQASAKRQKRHTNEVLQ